MAVIRASVLEVDRERPLSAARVVSEELPEPGPGQVRLDVEAFGLSSNNVSYALLGDTLGHWRPFPAAAGWGRVPAWGLARVTGGDPALVPAGARLVGYLPMATRFLLTGAPAPAGIEVTAPERDGMLPMYRRMRRIDTDPAWDERHAGVELQLLPLAPLAALLSRDLLEQEPSQVVVSSASSKTGLVLGRLLRAGNVRTVGLTGAARTAEVTRTGAFDEVLAYDRTTSVRGTGGTVYVDISGDPAITRAVHEHLGPALIRSVAVGGSHLPGTGTGAGPGGSAGPPGPAPVRFSVGRRETELLAELGGATLDRLLAEARATLVGWAATWMSLRTTDGLDAARADWRRVAHGGPPGLGAVVVRP
ncbi:DUF2855 family protein [Pseudonocardia kongjuensis]